MFLRWGVCLAAILVADSAVSGDEPSPEPESATQKLVGEWKFNLEMTLELLGDDSASQLAVKFGGDEIRISIEFRNSGTAKFITSVDKFNLERTVEWKVLEESAERIKLSWRQKGDSNTHTIAVSFLDNSQDSLRIKAPGAKSAIVLLRAKQTKKTAEK